MMGRVPGVEEGALFDDRKALHYAGIHRGFVQGIGAGGESIVLSGGYIDDLDDGDIIIYTGEGGRDSNTKRQIADQELTRGNLNLARHYNDGNPIRVSRGSNLDSQFAPQSGYRYDGLYQIDHFWHEQGVHGFKIYRYRLIKIEKSLLIDSVGAGDNLGGSGGDDSPDRTSLYTSRIIRSSAVTNKVKGLYDSRCQISGEVLETPAGRYAEGCHIKPLGRPHNGPDVASNVLCLSPNIHVLFDKGAVAILDDFTLLGMSGTLTVHENHRLDLEYIRYHRLRVFNNNDLVKPTI